MTVISLCCRPNLIIATLSHLLIPVALRMKINDGATYFVYTIIAHQNPPVPVANKVALAPMIQPVLVSAN